MIEPTNYEITGSIPIKKDTVPRAQILYAQIQGLPRPTNGAEQNIARVDSVTYPNYGQTVHMPGTTAHIKYPGTGPSDFDRAQVTLFADTVEQRDQAKSILEGLATKISVQEEE